VALRNSALFQADRHSYLLYPDHDLPGFMQKNSLRQEQVGHLALFTALLEAQDETLITRDVYGRVHFSGHIRNFQDVTAVLETLKRQPRYQKLIDGDYEQIKALFEETFHHNEFTGRSGTFFAYEGLGSIYWHMVSKLLLAAQETALRYKNEAAGPALIKRYRDIQAGLGFRKTPATYGAFPTDPYSHTPRGRGAKQPGMTGMVKETILARQADLGFSVNNGRVAFDHWLIDPRELLPRPAEFIYQDVNGITQQIPLKAGSLAYTICQTPVVIATANKTGICVHFSDGTKADIQGNTLDEENSRHVFQRDGYVVSLIVGFSNT
jgi:hypothetical protein